MENVMFCALCLFIQYQKSNIIYNNHRIGLFDALVMKELDHLPNDLSIVYNQEQGQPKYSPYGYDKEMRSVCDPFQGRTKQWLMRGTTGVVEGKAGSGMKAPPIVARVVAELYPDGRVTYLS